MVCKLTFPFPNHSATQTGFPDRNATHHNDLGLKEVVVICSGLRALPGSRRPWIYKGRPNQTI